MRLRHLLPLLALLAAAALAVPGAADAKPKYKVGFGDQNPSLFDDANFQALRLKRVRLIVPYDFRRTHYQLPITTDWITRAQSRGYEVLVAFQARDDCFRNGRYSKAKACRAPSPKTYRKAFRDFRKLFPKVRLYQPWNEINSSSQPTAKHPKRAAQYYNIVKQDCKRCTVVAGDFLDSSTVLRYVSKFRRYVKGSPKLWGLHNYSDVNRPKQQGKYTKALMRALPGQIWLTETGGLVKFGKNFRYSPSRANRATKNLFKLADQLSVSRRGYRSRVTRVYPYTFFGEARSERFDAGLVGPLSTTGEPSKPRPAYRTFKKLVRKRSK